MQVELDTVVGFFRPQVNAMCKMMDVVKCGVPEWKQSIQGKLIGVDRMLTTLR